MKSDFIKELQKDREKLTNQNDAIIDNITEKCIKNIKFINHSGNTQCIYEVPLITLGFPLYDISTVSIAVNKKLKKMGLNSLYVQPNKLYISWKKI